MKTLISRIHFPIILILFLSFFALVPISHGVTLIWDRNTEDDLAGYKVYYGNSPELYRSVVDVGNVTEYRFRSLNEGVTYYIAITAYDNSRNESQFSVELDYLVDDGILDNHDNCPKTPNGPNLGTCVRTLAGMVVSCRVGEPKSFIICTSDDGCEDTDGYCQMTQGDCNSNGCGDVCECYYDINHDGKVSAPDFAVQKWEYGRMNCPSSGGNYDYFETCQAQPDQTSCEGTSGCVWDESKSKCYTTSCLGDVTLDGRVSAPDYSMQKQEYGRLDCPACP